MNTAVKRVISSFLLLLIFGFALYLRFYGVDWALKDNIYSPHPDERHYETCANAMNFYGLSEEEQKRPLAEQWQLFYERNLNTEAVQGMQRDFHNPNSPFFQNKPGLMPVNYNYGTFPLHLYILYQSYVQEHSQSDEEWTLLAFPDWLSEILLLFVLILGIRMFIKISRDLRESRYQQIPWHKDDERLSLFFPALILPFTGFVLFFYAPYWLLDFSQYDPNRTSILLSGRLVSAWLGSLTILMAYLIGRDAYNRMTGLIAAFMLTTAMLHVQTSHYATVDAILGFWATAAVYCFLKISQKPRLIWYLLGAVCTGFAVSTKWSGVALPGILWLAHAIATWGNEKHGKLARWIHSFWLLVFVLLLAHFFKCARSTDPLLDTAFAHFRDFYLTYGFWFLIAAATAVFLSLTAFIIRKIIHEGSLPWFKPAWETHIPWLWLILAIPLGVFAFFLGEPMAYFDSHEFARNIAEQSAINVTGERTVPYTLQFRNTMPFFYSLDNLFYPSLDYLTAFFVLTGCIYAAARIFIRRSSADLLLTAWVIPSFLMYSSFSSKYPRYLVIILPVMIVFGARLLVDLWRMRPSFFIPELPWLSINAKRWLRTIGFVGGGLALLCGFIYGNAYVGIYDQEHTLITAGKWLRENMASGEKITQQSWDEGIHGIHVSHQDQLFIHDRSAEQRPHQRTSQLAQYLHEYDWIVLQSKRGYGSTLRNPDYFPVTNKFLKSLFAEQLGFHKVKVISNSPTFLGWEFRFDEEDETARIYDHPKIVIFQKVKSFDQEDYQSLIMNPPQWVNDVSASDIYRARDGYPIFSQHKNHPLLTWWLTLQLLGWIAFIYLFPLCGFLPERGYILSKVIGIALFSWLSWLLASCAIFPLSRLQTLIILLLMLAIAVLLTQRYGQAIKEFIKEKWLTLLSFEGLYLFLFILFLLLRAYHPAIYSGEKAMNFSFINATYRADTFPPEDPWIAGYWINYYYYGHAVFSIIGRMIGLTPEYLFNIAGATVSALVGINIFAMIFALCRRVWVSFLGLYLTLFAGHIISYINIIRQQVNPEGKTIWFAQVDWKDCLVGIYGVVKLMLYSLMTYLGIASDSIQQQISQLKWDLIFWQSRTDIFLGSVANEFPFWTHLYMDFHAHMVVVPFTLAFLGLMYAYFARPRNETPFSHQSAVTFFLALLLGTVICTNTWDFPGLLLGLLFVVGVKFWRESKFMNPGDERIHWCTPSSLQSLLRFPLGHFLSVIILAVLLYLPFHFNFVSRISEIRFMTEGNTPISAYLGFWAHLLFPILISIIFLAIVRYNGTVSLLRSFSFAILFILTLSFALWVTQTNPFNYPPPHPFDYPPYVGWVKPMDYSVVGLFLPFLIVMFFMMWNKKRESGMVFALLLGVLGLGLSLGIEFFYVKEQWSEPRHRYNTDFKFNLQVWRYLSMFAALGIFYTLQRFKAMKEHLHPWFVGSMRGVYLGFLFILIFLTIPFAVIAPAVVTQSSRAQVQEARGNTPTLNGLEWMRQENYEAYSTIHWLHQFINETPNTIEAHGPGYGQTARFATHTGLPTLLGWDHHVSERIHFNNERNIRVGAQRLFFQTEKREEIERIIGRFDLDYLLFGELEHNLSQSEETLNRIEEWGDLFNLIYRLGKTSVFRINKTLNEEYGMTTPSTQVAQAQQDSETSNQEKGKNMLHSATGTKNGEFKECRGLEQGPKNRIYLADTLNHRIQVFDNKGDYLWKGGEKGDGKGQFMEPNDVTIDQREGDIYITDTWNHRIVRLDKNGSYIGAAKLDFFGPRGIAYHPTWKVLYISDTGHHQVKVMTTDGQLNQTWGKNGGGNSENAFLEPVGIDILPDGNVIVVDGKNKRLKVYTPQGELLHIWPIQTSWDGTSGFEGHITSTPDGIIYMTDPYERSVHIYTSEGELSGKITTDVQGTRLQRPVGITYTRTDQLLVTDLHMNRVLRLR